MWSTINNYGLLQRFQQLYAINPYGFNQVDHPSIDYVPKVWSQYDRELVSGLISKELLAFNKMLGYNIMPVESYEEIAVEDISDIYDGFNLNDSLYLSELGSTTRTLLGTSNVTYTNDIANFSFTTSELNSNEYIEIFFRSSDGAVNNSQSYRIFNVRSVYNGTSYLFTVNKWLMVKPSLQSTFDESLVPNVEQSFVTSVDIYKVTVSSTNSVVIYSYDDTSNYTKSLDGIIIDAKQSKIKPRTEVDITGTPYKVRVNYIAGYPFSSRSKTEFSIFTIFENLLLRRVRLGIPLSYHQQAFTTSTRYNNDFNLVDGVRYIDIEVQRMVDTYRNNFLGGGFYG